MAKVSGDLVACIVRWDECQRLKVSQHERGRKEGQELEDDDSQGWIAAFERTAKRMLRYLEDWNSAQEN